MSADNGAAQLQVFVAGVDVKGGISAVQLCADGDGEIGANGKIDGADGTAAWAGEIDAAVAHVDGGGNDAAPGEAQRHLKMIGLIIKTNHGYAIGQPILPFEGGAQFGERGARSDASACEER